MELGKQLDDVEGHRNVFRQLLIEQQSNLRQHSVLTDIDRWESDAIGKIQATAEQTRQIVLKSVGERMEQLELRLNSLTDQLRQSREEDDFFEADIYRWNEELTRLTQELTKSSHIKLQEDTTALIMKITIDTGSTSLSMPTIDPTAKWIQHGITVAGGNRDGSGLNQLSNPWGLCIDANQAVYIAEYSNNRVVEWKLNENVGRVVAGGNGRGNQMNQLYAPADVILDELNDCLIIADHGNERVVRWPRSNSTTGQVIVSNVDCWGLAMDNNGYLYVADYNKCEVRKWRIGDSKGVLVAGGNGKGNRLDQLSGRFYICVDEEQSVYVSDEDNHRVVKWTQGAKHGIVVAGGHKEGASLSQLSRPKGVIVDKLGTIYVVDQNNHRIMRWLKNAKQGSILVGKNGRGDQANQLFNPLGLHLDQQGNLYVVDNGNCRVQRFNIDSSTNL
ncbi:unnamed protein product [Adineta ricciae]|uniref:Uncharacterized protein n=1 Tax=Adineta ricciae TaxID=249248 RepID=A0A814K1Z1_ADIRI|nr:unnamed protein product [Adineta ricciae]CAF1281496.1 unnamed protein product [Adineta ricciae]